MNAWYLCCLRCHDPCTTHSFLVFGNVGMKFHINMSTHPKKKETTETRNKHTECRDTNLLACDKDSCLLDHKRNENNTSLSTPIIEVSVKIAFISG